MGERQDLVGAAMVEAELAVLDVKPRAPAPAERRCRCHDRFDRRDHAAQCGRDDRVLRGDLARDRDMLPLATAAALGEVHARRRDALRRRCHDLDELAARERLGLLDEPHAHAITGRCERDERDAAVGIAGDAIATGGKRMDVDRYIFTHRYALPSVTGTIAVPRGASSTRSARPSRIATSTVRTDPMYASSSFGSTLS